jgi:hypothetical protein
MTFLPGTQLAKLWFDPAWFTDQRRNTVFQALAGLMSQLSTHEFSSISQLDIDPRTHAHCVGPFYPDLGTISEGETCPEPICGPYQSTHVYLQDQIADKLEKETRTTVISELQLLRTFAGMIPDSTFDGAPFFLSHPDFGYQNILVDAEGNVTGMIDWDDVAIGPRQSAFARYPSWITRDWDPFMYCYRKTSDVNLLSLIYMPLLRLTSCLQSGEDLSRETQQEDSPETLSRFRDEYLAAFTRLKPSHGRLTRYSHLIEALEIAISHSFTRADILDKFTKYVYGGNDDDDVEFSSFVTLARRLSKGNWVRDTVGEEKLVAGGEYV